MLAAAGCGVVAAVVLAISSSRGEMQDPLTLDRAERRGVEDEPITDADLTGGPVVQWVPEALPLDVLQAPTAGQPSGGGQLLPNASGVYEARPPFLIERTR